MHCEKWPKDAYQVPGILRDRHRATGGRDRGHVRRERRVRLARAAVDEARRWAVRPLLSRRARL